MGTFHSFEMARTLARAADALRAAGPALARLTELERIERLRSRHPPEVARAAAQLFALRARAAPRLGELELLTRRGLEQASRAEVAGARAARMAERAPGARAIDATCGLGGDALALAGRGLLALACDRDPLHAACARANLRARGVAAPVAVADALRLPVRSGGGALLLLDPDRRAAGERSLDPDAWSPPLGAALELAAERPGACLKLAPAAQAERLLGRLPRGLRASCQWVSAGGELLELALWTGVLAQEAGLREVLQLGGPRGGEERFHSAPETLVSLPPERVSEIRWLADPDPALVRSGLLGALARREGLAALAPRSAYLAGDQPPSSGLLTPYRVLGSAPLDRRRVRALLAAHDVGPLQVLKRGHPDPAEVLERRLAGPGRRRGILVVARLERGHVALLVERDAA